MTQDIGEVRLELILDAIKGGATVRPTVESRRREVDERIRVIREEREQEAQRVAERERLFARALRVPIFRL